MADNSNNKNDTCDVTGPESEPYQSSIKLFTLDCIPKLFKENNPISISILLTDDREIQRMNSEFRGVDSPTDVLSFENDFISPDGVLHAGEIAISIPYAERTKDKRPLDEYILFLVAHGLLHLSGHHHETEKERTEVIEMGEKLLKEYQNES